MSEIKSSIEVSALSKEQMERTTNTSKQNTNCFGNRSSIIYGCGHSGTDA